jgi:hypothetical protein
MRTIVILLALAAVAEAQSNRPPGWDKGKKAGWDGELPPGWEKKTDKEKEEHLAAVDAGCEELKVHVENCLKVEPKLELGVDVSVDLFKRCVNAGFPVHASLELVKGCVELKLPKADAEIAVKTCSCESFEKDVDHENLGQWVKEQIKAGKRGPELAECIKVEINKRHEEKQKAKGHSDDKGNKGGGKGKGKGK